MYEGKEEKELEEIMTREGKRRSPDGGLVPDPWMCPLLIAESGDNGFSSHLGSAVDSTHV